MFPTVSEIAEAIGAVEQPELRRTLGELGIVPSVATDGATVVVAVADPLPDHGHWAELADRIRAVVGALDGVEQVAVDVAAMPDGAPRPKLDVAT